MARAAWAEEVPEVPQAVEERILLEARRAADRTRKRRTSMRRLRLAAAAAGILLALGIARPWRYLANDRPHRYARSAVCAADIDGNGAVDILDAFTLARHLESRKPTKPVWDLNGDGLVDYADVDAVAAAAVAIDGSKG